MKRKLLIIAISIVVMSIFATLFVNYMRRDRQIGEAKVSSDTIVRLYIPAWSDPMATVICQILRSGTETWQQTVDYIEIDDLRHVRASAYECIVSQDARYIAIVKTERPQRPIARDDLGDTLLMVYDVTAGVACVPGSLLEHQLKVLEAWQRAPVVSIAFDS